MQRYAASGQIFDHPAPSAACAKSFRLYRSRVIEIQARTNRTLRRWLVGQCHTTALLPTYPLQLLHSQLVRQPAERTGLLNNEKIPHSTTNRYAKQDLQKLPTIGEQSYLPAADN